MSILFYVIVLGGVIVLLALYAFRGKISIWLQKEKVYEQAVAEIVVKRARSDKVEWQSGWPDPAGVYRFISTLPAHMRTSRAAIATKARDKFKMTIDEADKMARCFTKEVWPAVQRELAEKQLAGEQKNNQR
jgi:hypothetical protein